MAQRNVPSVERIATYLSIPEENAAVVRGLLKGTISTRAIKGAGYTMYDKFHDRKMKALNHVIDGYGVEAVGDFNSYPPVCYFEYVNTGDTYNPTIVYCNGFYSLTTFGDKVESLERRGVKLP